MSRWRAGASIRKIARELGMARNTVSGVLAQIDAQRAGHEGSAHSDGPVVSIPSSRSSSNCWVDIPI